MFTTDLDNHIKTFAFQNPQQFVLDLLKYLHDEMQNDVTNDRAEHIMLALNALANCIIKNPGMFITVIFILPITL